MDKWNTPADKQAIEETIVSLKKKNIDAYLVENKEEAKKKFFEILPQGVEILNNSSVTLDEIGISQEIMESGKYSSVKKQLMAMDRKTQRREMQKLSTAPQWAAGSVHAVSKDGQIIIASSSGSQLPGYIYGADHVIFVVGVQKIVDNFEDGIKRLYEHSLILESERVKIAYGMDKSHIRRILTLVEEAAPGRTTVIFVNEAIGY